MYIAWTIRICDTAMYGKISNLPSPTTGLRFLIELKFN